MPEMLNCVGAHALLRRGGVGYLRGHELFVLVFPTDEEPRPLIMRNSSERFTPIQKDKEFWIA